MSQELNKKLADPSNSYLGENQISFMEQLPKNHVVITNSKKESAEEEDIESECNLDDEAEPSESGSLFQNMQTL